jgi:hypothetical protein
MTKRKEHIVHVGFNENYADSIDFDNYNVTVLLDRYTAEHLSKLVRKQFSRIGILDLPRRLDLDNYDRATDQMIALVEEFSKEFGAPSAIVGIYEYTTMPAARLREHFGVFGTDSRTALLFRDKVLMKEALRGVVRLPRFWNLGSATPMADLQNIAADLPGKIVLKPKSQAASLGIEIFDGAADFLEYARTTGIQDDYEVEEFIEGSVCHFDGIIREGKIRFLSASKYLGDYFTFQHRGGPLASLSIEDPVLISRIFDFTDRVLETLGLRDSTFHLEAFQTPDDDLVFLEVGNRFGGAYTSNHIKAVYGVDLVEESIAACMNLPSTVEETVTNIDFAADGYGASGALYSALREKSRCRVKSIHGLDTCPDSVILSEIPNVGQVVNEHQGVFVGSGMFILAGESPDTIEQDMRKIIESYSVDVEVLEESPVR